VQYLAVFGGIKEDTSDVEVSLHGAKDIKTVKEVAHSQSWPIQEVVENELYSYIVFRQKHVEVFGPIVWIGVKPEAYQQDINENFDGNVVIQLKHNVHICKYMKYLLIDAYRKCDASIDVKCIIPHGYEISFSEILTSSEDGSEYDSDDSY
jgi:hypothetical protein